MNKFIPSILSYNPGEMDDFLSLPVEIIIGRKCYIETYGCQMNFSDTRIIMSVLKNHNFELTSDLNIADVILLNTCSIRDNAVQRVFKRIRELKHLKKKNPGLIIGMLGCIPEHSKSELFEKEPALDLVAGPDSYRHLPQLIELAENGRKILDTSLQNEETYDNLIPDYQSSELSAYISIMRGCDNFCSYCVVPSTRGRERSRHIESIINETKALSEKGFKEITLLGQNVNSYHFTDASGKQFDFASLLEMVALTAPSTRIRFATSHPKDISEKVIRIIAKYENICKHIHLALQSGSDRILQLMNRNYSSRSFIEKISLAREIIPGISITTDIIAGFCTETIEDHLSTLEVMKQLKFDLAYMFRYSERNGTFAEKNLDDDVPEAEKKRRLAEIIQLQSLHSLENNKNDIGKIFTVLVEGSSKRSALMLKGRNSQNKMVVFPASGLKIGDMAEVIIVNCTSATLIGKPLTEKVNPGHS